MVFTIQSQYIDSLGKLRIIYGFYNKQLINLLTFPLAPLNKVPIETRNKVQSFPINIKKKEFIEDLKEDLKCDEVVRTSTGYRFINSTFPPSVFVPIDTNNPAPFPLMIDGVSDYHSELDTYKDRIHKANIFKQYVIFLYSCDSTNYDSSESFVVKENHDYDFENWNPSNWMSLQNEKMIVISNLSFSPSVQQPILLSKMSNQTFQLLNAKRLETCIKEGEGKCESIHLAKPSESNQWMEYQSPAGGHCLFHSVLRGWAKLHQNHSQIMLMHLLYLPQYHFHILLQI